MFSKIDGYYSYNKDKGRRFTSNRTESIKRKVFLKDLNYNTDIDVIKNIYVERAYRWGSSMEDTRILTMKDTFYADNEPNKPYQIVIDYFKYYNHDSDIVAVNPFRIILSDFTLMDTIEVKVYIRNKAFENDKLKSEHTIKIWQ